LPPLKKEGKQDKDNFDIKKKNLSFREIAFKTGGTYGAIKKP